jgi:hypothetical protein
MRFRMALTVLAVTISMVAVGAARSEATTAPKCTAAADGEVAVWDRKAMDYYSAGDFSEAARWWQAVYSYYQDCEVEKQDPPGNDEADNYRFREAWAINNLAYSDQRGGDARAANLAWARASSLFNEVIKSTASPSRRESAIAQQQRIANLVSSGVAGAQGRPSPQCPAGSSSTPSFAGIECTAR